MASPAKIAFRALICLFKIADGVWVRSSYTKEKGPRRQKGAGKRGAFSFQATGKQAFTSWASAEANYILAGLSRGKKTNRWKHTAVLWGKKNSR